MSAGALVHTQTYDSLGNPLSYKNLKGIYNYNFTWKNGRQLASTTQYATSTYTYDANGYRLTRTVNGVEYKYTWVDGLLMSQTWGNEIMIFFYDESGSPIGFGYRYGSGDSYDYYYYEKNLQGDIVGIFDQSGTRIVEYTYDAWGESQGMSGQGAYPLGFNNPFRYRGYYFDYETNLYYLQSRYYDPVNGRFISPDTYITTGQGLQSYNMYAYCGNDPVNRVDATGEFWKSIKKGAKAVGSAIASGGKAVGNAAVTTGKAVGDAVVTSGKAIGNVAVETWDWIKDVAQSAFGGIKTAGIAVGNFVVDRFSTPEKAANTFGLMAGTLGVVSAYSAGVAAGLAIPTLGMSVPTAGTVAVVTGITAAVFGLVAAVINIFNEE